MKTSPVSSITQTYTAILVFGFQAVLMFVAYLGIIIDKFGDRLELHRLALVEHLIKSVYCPDDCDTRRTILL
jgi:hypothetical protein